MFKTFEVRPPRVEAVRVTTDNIFRLMQEYDGKIETASDNNYLLEFQINDGPIIRVPLGNYLAWQEGSDPRYFLVWTPEEFTRMYRSVASEDCGISIPAVREKFDEDTLFKVHRVIRDFAESDEVATDLINQLQNEGILFRERA